MSSGSAVTGGGAEEAAAVPLGQKLMVHVAENGHTLEFQCGGDTLVEAIQHSIHHLCVIPPSDQLLLCGNTSLDGANALAYYKLPRDDREVFLYNKARLLADSRPPAPESIYIPEPNIPPPPPRPQDSSPVGASADPALKALAASAGGAGAGASAGHSTEQPRAHVPEALTAVLRIPAVLHAAAPFTC